jgi:hypothetical protein
VCWKKRNIVLVVPKCRVKLELEEVLVKRCPAASVQKPLPITRIKRPYLWSEEMVTVTE